MMDLKKSAGKPAVKVVVSHTEPLAAMRVGGLGYTQNLKIKPDGRLCTFVVKLKGKWEWQVSLPPHSHVWQTWLAVPQRLVDPFQGRVIAEQ